MIHACNTQLARRGSAGIVIDPCVLDNDHADPARSDVFVVPQHPIGNGTIRVGKSCMLGSFDHPVLELDVSYPSRLKQFRKISFHEHLPPYPLVLVSFIF
jgi:hypothetical protein